MRYTLSVQCNGPGDLLFAHLRAVGNLHELYVVSERGPPWSPARPVLSGRRGPGPGRTGPADANRSRSPVPCLEHAALPSL
jgi:hypothetical protein